MDLCAQKLERAEKLIGGLGGEKDRWREAAQELGGRYDLLTGDMLISAGIISYLGPFTSLYREEAVGKWMKLCSGQSIPFSASFSLRSALGNPVLMREWAVHGLPADSFSVDNGIMVASSRRWPLMIDPQASSDARPAGPRRIRASPARRPRPRARLTRCRGLRRRGRPTGG